MAKKAVKTDALNTVGVVDVRNYIDIGNEIKVSDGSIEDNIERAIRDHPILYGYHIEVRVENGIVRLMGTVDTDLEKELAEELVLEIRGVKSVDNRLSVNE